MRSPILFVVNAKAGTAQAEAVEAARAELASAAQVELARPGNPGELARALGDLGDRSLVLAGGDGSAHLAVRTLLRRDPGWLASNPIGLVPLGTGNDLAGGLGLPDDPVDAARLCLEGSPRQLDLIVTNFGVARIGDSPAGLSSSPAGPTEADPRDDFDEVVVNAAHTGLGAAAAARSAPLKPSLGALAYPLGAVIAAVREAAWQLRITVDGDVVHDGQTLMVGIANAPLIGGGTRLCPPARPDDGLLDVVIVTAVGPAARLAFGAALRNGAHLDRDDVRHVSGRSVTIAGEAVAHVLDGELIDEHETATYAIRPGAWSLITPAEP